MSSAVPQDGSDAVSGPSDTVLTVAQLNRAVARLLAGGMPPVWVRGEISNFTQAASGHWYFSIKDPAASVRAVMFRTRARLVGFTPRAGEQCEFRAAVTLYEPRGDYQLQVDAIRRAGLGNLHEQFLRLKETLGAQGLFDPQRKRQPASMPRTVGVVTSLAAAALRDVLTTLQRRAPHVRIIVYPSPVQGAEAAGSLVQALRLAAARAEVDTLLLVRGGGSLEDLWSFNDETLVRTVAQSPIPVISGVGHETDFTLADFAADVRAPTPTAAAELCCRARTDCLRQLQSVAGALQALQRRRLDMAALRLDRAAAQLVSPMQRLQRQRERLQALARRLAQAQLPALAGRMAALRAAQARLDRVTPDMARRRHALRLQADALARLAAQETTQRRRRLEGLAQTLQALNPSGVLARGYAIVRDARGGVVRDARELRQGQPLDIRLAQGDVAVVVQGADGGQGRLDI